jgi:transketolase
MKDYNKISNNIRKDVVEMIFNSKTSHLGSSLSCVDILTVLYFEILKINPQKPLMENRDRFILSKGHAVAALYATLAERGFFEKKLLKEYCTNGSKLPGHVSYGYIPGIEISTGSLGHGLSIANGIALAGKKDKKKYRVFVLLSDGECDEGSTWEAILFAGHHKLNNLVAIIDYNKWQALGKTNEILNLEPFAEKWRDFGWSVKEVNGHNFQEIYNALIKIPFEKNKPSVLIAHTIKAKGLPSLENKLESHYRPPTEQEYKEFINKVNNL